MNNRMRRPSSTKYIAKIQSLVSTDGGYTKGPRNPVAFRISGAGPRGQQGRKKGVRVAPEAVTRGERFRQGRPHISIHSCYDLLDGGSR